ncbi:MAG: prenyltransferase [Bacteroidetes bacterium]|nr:MAG: prenyltransferase [Bacteroidota bacterium]PTM15201.1 MAG: prenyltransferase [Bacteroidota bacterium]
MLDILKQLRLHQWLKNTFIFLPLFFSGQLGNWLGWKACIVAFFAFSLVASSIYCLNDICDLEVDRQHPVKRNRPLASGAISKFNGYFLLLVCLFLGLTLIILFGGEQRWAVLGIMLFYYTMNIAYTLKLKFLAIVDVFIIAIGFVLRVIIGGVATQIVVSHWLVLMTFLLALFMAFAKRRDDVIIYRNTGVKSRKNVDGYNLDYMNQTLSILATITLVCYIMYTVSEEVIARLGPYVFVTVIFVLAGILRYLQIVIVNAQSGSPTKILMKDHFIQVCILCWITSFVILIYF